MGIEGGSSNNEIQNQEINQSNNEQLEQNRAEHQRGGEELEGNSSIENEGERKQVEGKDDATDSAEDESEKLDDNSEIEDDYAQNNPEDVEGSSESQELDNQDSIEADNTSVENDGNDSPEVTDSLDDESTIEDDLSDDVEADSETENGDAESLDNLDSIDDDTDVEDYGSDSESLDEQDSLDELEEADDTEVDTDSVDKSDNTESEQNHPEETDAAEADTDSVDESDNTEAEADQPEEADDTQAGTDSVDESDNAEAEQQEGMDSREADTDAVDGADNIEAEGNQPEKTNSDDNHLESDTPQETEKTPQEIQDGINKFYSDCGEIGRDSNLSPKEKVEAMQEKFAELGDGNRGDAQCLSSEKYLNEKEPFNDEGRARVDYPDHQGFNMENGRGPEPISRDNPMQDSVDRYGSPGGNFVAGMENGEPASFESRALPNIENPDSYHSYEVDNGRYCDAVDLVRNCDPENMEPSVDSINDMIDSINQENGLDLDHIDLDDMKDMLAHYDDYQRNLANDIPEINPAEAPYGLSGEAAPWDSASGERLSDGDADQKWLPLTVNDFEIMGIFKEI